VTTVFNISLSVEEAPGGSVATLRGRTRASDFMNDIQNSGFEAAGMSGLRRKHGEAEDAVWKGEGKVTSSAFGEMAKIANALPHFRVEYSLR
jgi:hypothetical protein